MRTDREREREEQEDQGDQEGGPGWDGVTLYLLMIF
jgi:hypothetical protein